MAGYGDSRAETFGGQDSFPTTHWSVVLLAGQGQDTQCQEALARLCETYRPPILAYAASLGLAQADAEDFTQSFFLHFLQHNLAGKVEPRARAKFRSFLLRCFKNFLGDEWDRRAAQKRGGGQITASLDEPVGESDRPWEPSHELDAGRIFEREWASALLNDVLDRLQSEYAARDRRGVFEQLQVALLDKQNARPYAEMGAELGLSEDAVKKEISRMRQRYRELFRQEVARTVGTLAEVDEEIAHLFAVLSD